MRHARHCLASAFCALAIAACGGGDNGVGVYKPGPPVEVTPGADDTFVLAAPADVGMDAGTLAAALSDQPANNGVSSMIVMRHGKPVFEQYWNGYDKDTLHDLRSATKSITSLLVGIAIDQHALGGVHDTVAQWLSADYPNAPVLSRGLVLEDLLTMRSGLACNDWDDNSQGQEEFMYESQDWVQFWLDLPSTSAPGTTASYCTGNPVALGHILADATHQKVTDYAQSVLLGPLGITTAVWNTYDNGTQTDTGGHLHMRPRDMLKIGQLALQGGAWQGRQLVSSAWIAASTRLVTSYDDDPDDTFSGYGYLWWHGTTAWNGTPTDVFFADGAGGQYIFVVPSLDLVAVFTGESYTAPAYAAWPIHLLEAYILPAVKS